MHISSNRIFLILCLFLLPIISIHAQDNQIVVSVSIKLVNQAGQKLDGVKVELFSTETELSTLQKTSDKLGRVVFNLLIEQLSKYDKIKVFNDKVILLEDEIKLKPADLVRIDDNFQALPTIELKIPVPQDSVEIKNKIVAGLVNQAKKLIEKKKSKENFDLAVGFAIQAKALNDMQKNPDPLVLSAVIEIYESYLQFLYSENMIKEGLDLLGKIKPQFPDFKDLSSWQERFNLQTLPVQIRQKYEAALIALEKGEVEKAIAEFSELIKLKDEIIPYFQKIFASQLDAAKEMMVSKILEEALKAYEKEDYENALRILSKIPQFTENISPAALAIEEVVRIKLGMNTRNESPTDGKNGLVKCELKPEGKNKQGYEEFTRSTDGMIVVMMPEREITIGDTTGIGRPENLEEDKEYDEIPTKTLKLRPFYYDKFEVSNEQYCKFLNSVDPRGLLIRFYSLDSISAQIEFKTGIYMPKEGKDDYPAQNVSWFGANAYSLWAWGHNWRDFEGADCLLPTTAMFECVAACAPKKKRIYPWGDEFDQSKIVCERGKIYQWDVIPTVKTSEFAQSSSYCGIYNLSGNVWEWIANAGTLTLYDTRNAEEAFLLKTAETELKTDNIINYKRELKEHIERFIKYYPDRAEKFKEVLEKLTNSIEKFKDTEKSKDYMDFVVPKFDFPKAGDFEFNASDYAMQDYDMREYRGGGFSSSQSKTRSTVRSWDAPSKTKHYLGFRTAIFAETQEKHEVNKVEIPKATFDPIAKGLEYLGKNEQGFREYKRPKDGMIMIEIPAGDFYMGSDVVTEAKPAHLVGLDMYLVDKYEVSNGQFAAFLEEYGTDRIKGGTNAGKVMIKETIWGFMKDKEGKWQLSGDKSAPVVGITWFGAQEYAKWAKAELLTEAQWEKAARGKDSIIYPWGNDEPDKDKANYQDTYSLRPMQVNKFKAGASPFGCYNLSGNVWELTMDFYDEAFYSSIEAKKINPVNLKEPKPKNPSSPNSDRNTNIDRYHVARGGGSNSDVKNIRTFIRQAVHEETSSLYLGFRCAYNGKVDVIEKKSATSDDSSANNGKKIPSNIISLEEPDKKRENYQLHADAWDFAKFTSNAEYGGKISENLNLILVETRQDGIEIYQRQNDSMKIVRVPGGYFKVGDVFRIGTTDESQDKYIWVPEFFMDLTEISNEQYCNFLNAAKISYSLAAKFYDFENTNSELTFDGNEFKATDFTQKLPVRFVSFSGANAYSLWVWNQGWQNYENISCLPTEAMFEKAAAYDYADKSKRIFSFGNEILNREKLSINKESTMETDKSSGDESFLGVMHLSDNVSEWCVDAFLNETCGKLRQLGVDLPQREYLQDSSSYGRVVKGANYMCKNLKKLRCSFRNNMQETVKSSNIGFRCAYITGYFLSPIRKTENQEVKIVNTNSKIELKEITKNYKNSKRFKRLKDNMNMILIDAGDYNVDVDFENITDDSGANNVSKKKLFTKVKLSKYLIDETEVSVEMYCKFLADYKSSIVKDGIYKGKTILFENSHSQINIVKLENEEIEYKPKKSWENRPIYDITWYGAYEYAKWAGGELPTEAQWESAARGKTVSIYPWGDDVPTFRHACFKIGKRIVIPGKVGSYRLGNSNFGVKDLSGNVWEWCLDNYHIDRKNMSNEQNPCDFRLSKNKVIKGGCYNSNAETIKISTRRGINPDLVYSLIGFRCVYNFTDEIPDVVDESNIR